MATAATSLLGLALPVTGDLSGLWGDVVNNSITSLLDSAVAGTTTLSSDVDVTLDATSLVANQARSAVLRCTGARTGIKTITAPAQSKVYVFIQLHHLRVCCQVGWRSAHDRGHSRQRLSCPDCLERLLLLCNLDHRHHQAVRGAWSRARRHRGLQRPGKHRRDHRGILPDDHPVKYSDAHFPRLRDFGNAGRGGNPHQQTN